MEHQQQEIQIEEQMTVSTLVQKDSIIQCKICMDNFNLINKKPLTICSNNHVMCSLCFRSGGLKTDYLEGRATGRYKCPMCNEYIAAKSIPQQNSLIVDVIKFVQMVKDKKYKPSRELIRQKQKLKQKNLDLKVQCEISKQELARVLNENKQHEKLKLQYRRLQQRSKMQQILLLNLGVKNHRLISKIYELQQICFDVLKQNSQEDQDESFIFEKDRNMRSKQSKVSSKELEKPNSQQNINQNNLLQQNLRIFFNSHQVRSLIQQDDSQKYLLDLCEAHQKKQVLIQQKKKKVLSIKKVPKNLNKELCFNPCSFYIDSKHFNFVRNIIQKNKQSNSLGLFGMQSLKFNQIIIFKFKVIKTIHNAIFIGIGTDNLRGLQNPFWDRNFWGYCLRNGRTTPNIVHELSDKKGSNWENLTITMEVDLSKNMLRIYIDQKQTRKLKMNLKQYKLYYPIVIMSDIGDKIQILPKQF